MPFVIPRMPFVTSDLRIAEIKGVRVVENRNDSDPLDPINDSDPLESISRCATMAR